MTTQAIGPRTARRGSGGFLAWIALAFSLTVISAPASAQQTGEIAGRVSQSGGAAMSGVSISARSSVLPQPRSTTSAANGRYRLPLLPPGTYEVTYRFPDGSERKRIVAVMLQQRADIDIAFNDVIEEIVAFGSQGLLDSGQASLKNSISADTIDGLPVGQEYRDLQKLIPGVQYSEDSVRGPSAGGSGQDNSYQFDGVDVSLPLFGTLSAEPSSHDIAQVSVVRGGAKAIGFNRSGGFLINTVSKSGTDEYHGEASYQVQTAGLTGDRKTGDSPEEFDEDRAWTILSFGGPIIQDRLFFYTSYYRPTSERSNSTNAYGSIPDFDSTRDEFFGKLTWSMTDNILLDGSFRSSDRSVKNRGVDEFEAASTSVGDEATLDIAILEGSWIINDDTSLNFKATRFENDTSSRPDTLFSFPITQGDSLNVAALDQQGFIAVPTPIAGETAYNAFIQPIIDQYGYLENGVLTGGGRVGGASSINDQDFERTSFEIGLDRLFYFGDTTHDVHIGYQYQELEEDLARLSNGWGSISVPGGRALASDGLTPIFYVARINQQSLIDTVGGQAIPPVINSRVEMQSFEINDTIEVGDWTYSIGVLISNDILFGQGLRPDTTGLNTVTGLEVAPGNRYKMYEVDWEDMIQPRLGVNWDYSDTSSVYANFARYHPSAGSLARAASWDRNLRRSIDVAFDANGNFIEIDPVRSSSGKFFQEGLDPRKIDEFLVGWTGDVSSELTLRAHVRHRRGQNFWEDTSNIDRVRTGNLPPAGIPQELYIPNLADVRAEIGGSSFVIAQLDTAYTRFWEVSGEAELNLDRLFLTGSYTWSHYYGNFDQDNTTTNNDANSFIGSSFIADGAGRQLWNFRDGNLRGDRRHVLKIYGFYEFDWSGQAGAYFVYQSGQPWEAWNVEIYRASTGSTSDTSRYAEPAGSRTTAPHWQLDLNYTHNIALFGDSNLQLRADIFNVFDRQTGYNIQNKVNSGGFGVPRDFFNPRRIQLALKFRF